MRDVTYIAGKDHTYTVHLPDGTPFHVEFQAGVGGHYPEPTVQKKSGKATKGQWVRGVPDEVADAWQANMDPAKSGFIIAAPAPAPKPKAAPKPVAKKAPAKKPAAKKTPAKKPAAKPGKK